MKCDAFSYQNQIINYIKMFKSNVQKIFSDVFRDCFLKLKFITMKYSWPLASQELLRKFSNNSYTSKGLRYQLNAGDTSGLAQQTRCDVYSFIASAGSLVIYFNVPIKIQSKSRTRKVTIEDVNNSVPAVVYSIYLHTGKAVYANKRLTHFFYFPSLSDVFLQLKPAYSTSHNS